MTTANKIQALENKLANIAKAIESYNGDNGIYARRKVLKLNELAAKAEKQISELKK